MQAVQCFTRTEAKDLARHCLTDGALVFGRHFREELAKEKLDISDAKFVLKHGHIYQEPEIDIRQAIGSIGSRARLSTASGLR